MLLFFVILYLKFIINYSQNIYQELLWISNFSNFNEMIKEWNIEILNSRHYNNELQYYTNNSFNFNNNELIIMMNKNKNNITSGRINTFHKMEFQYGNIEGYMKISNSTSGLWAAFWLLGNELVWPNCGEIDIMEYVSWNKNAIYGTLHGLGYSNNNAYSSGPYLLNNPISNNYHKYNIEWKPNNIKWFIDDILYFSASRNDFNKLNYNWIFDDRPFYIVLDLAVGGNFGGNFPNSENYIYSNLENYSEFIIKYIKIYKTNDGYGTIIKY
jgi:beta-glucanase (GH16 family)